MIFRAKLNLRAKPEFDNPLYVRRIYTYSQWLLEENREFLQLNLYSIIIFAKILGSDIYCKRCVSFV